ncbi:MAG: hypothetical protein KDD84_20915 [Caldilineaceae bacterium]|nr:hypothetical protein [Caldilineaceae bacterium]
MSESTYNWAAHPNPFIRIVGRDRPAAAALEDALTGAGPTFRRSASRSHPHSDYAQIDPQLPLLETDQPVPLPPPDAGYAGLTDAQRGFFYRWLHAPEQAAPPAYLRLYLAHIETHLFLGEKEATAARTALLDLLGTPAWSSFQGLTRAALLAGWLAQDDRTIARVLARGHVSPALMGVALGWQALLNHPLRGDEVLAAHRSWRGASEVDLPPAAIVQLNIGSLAATLGADPLQHALAQITPAPPPPVTADNTSADDTAAPEGPPGWPGAWTAWRCAHRDLTVELPAPDVRPTLAPLLSELLQTAQIFTQREIEASLALAAESDNEDAEDDTSGDDGVEISRPNWHLVLEFGESRSQFYDHVVFVAQKQPNYVMLMDEGRQIVHRLLYQKRNIRQFWRIWDYVQKWSNVRVYVNGQEVEKWKIWPYSPHMR